MIGNTLPHHAPAPSSRAEVQAALRPIPPKERVEVIDILRGFALFGILVVNIVVFASDYLPRTTMWPGIADLAVLRLTEIFFEDRFFRIYSLLFGLGFFIQLDRAKTRSARFATIYSRRLTVLFLLGVGHTLVWEGDILFYYGLLGFLLLFFRRCSSAGLLKWALVLALAPAVYDAVEHGLEAPIEPAPQVSQAVSEAEAEDSKEDKYARTLAQGTFKEIALQNLGHLLNTMRSDRFFLSCVRILGMFLLGFFVGQKRILHDSLSHKLYLQRVVGWGLGIGLVGTLLKISIEKTWNFPPLFPAVVGTAWAKVADSLLYEIAPIALCLGYMGGIALLASKPGMIGSALSRLAPVGRLSLSNFLLQTLICVTLFYGYGFGLFGKVSPWQWILLVLVIYLLQVWISTLWLRRFRFGPVEWLWRTLTYGRLQPMRIGP